MAPLPGSVPEAGYFARNIRTIEILLLAGLGALPGLRALRPALARIADRTDPVALQRMFASAMLAADPVASGVYYVDDHFVPYTGAKPVAKGWNNKRGRAEKGRADTHVTAHDGRAVCFVTGEPSGLSVTLPKALAELKKAAGPGAAIMVGVDRGGAYPQVFAHCRGQQVHWVTYRRAPLAVPAALPVITAVSYAGRTRQVAWAEETVQLKDYGQARQITLFEHGRGRPADPDLGLRCLPGGHPVLAEVPVAGGELPQVRQPELRHRQDLRLPGQHRDENQADPQPRPRPGERRRPRRGEDPRCRSRGSAWPARM